MTGDAIRARAESEQLGLSDDELASAPTVFRDDLLKGHSVLIAGGGSGMGRATAYLAARLGAEVMICGRREEKLRETAEGIRQRIGREIAWKAMTVRDPEQVCALMDEAWSQFGKIDTLVNSAGGQFIQESIDYSAKGWLAVIDTNLNGTWWMMQAAARKWREAGREGCIVNVVSVADRGIPQVVHTSAARGGIITVTKSVAVEWAPLRIRVNCVAPGQILSSGIGNYTEGHRNRLPNGNPMRRMGSTIDMAQAIVYLAAPSGGFITGEVLHVDGGAQLWGTSWPLGMPDWFKVDDDSVAADAVTP